MFEVKYRIINDYMDEFKAISLELFLKEHDMEGFFEICVNENSIGEMPDKYFPHNPFKEWLFSWFDVVLSSVIKLESGLPKLSFFVSEEAAWVELIRDGEQLTVSKKKYLVNPSVDSWFIENDDYDNEPQEVFWKEEILYTEYKEEILKKSKLFIEEFQKEFPNLSKFHRIAELQDQIRQIEGR